MAYTTIHFRKLKFDTQKDGETPLLAARASGHGMIAKLLESLEDDKRKHKVCIRELTPVLRQALVCIQIECQERTGQKNVHDSMPAVLGYFLFL